MYGILENILVKVDKFIFLTDFVLLDKDKYVQVPLILGRIFVATGRALNDVDSAGLESDFQCLWSHKAYLQEKGVLEHWHDWFSRQRQL